jgi:XTP/dITP diphosphohydrolase
MKDRQHGLERPLVLATRNPGKIAEFRELLSGFLLKSRVSTRSVPLLPPWRTAPPLKKTLTKRPCFTAKVLGLPALADDSGLVVPALGGDPGVRSARYAGNGADDLENNLKLLRAMEGMKNRKAVFECVIALPVPRGPALIYEGKCEGEIAEAPDRLPGVRLRSHLLLPSPAKNLCTNVF